MRKTETRAPQQDSETPREDRREQREQERDDDRITMMSWDAPLVPGRD